MSDFERINRDRPAKIVDMLRVIDASARSNKATPEEVMALLQPVYEKLDYGARMIAPPAATAAPPAAPMDPAAITTHDGNLVTALKRHVEMYGQAQVEAALGWVIRHRALK